MGSDTKDSQKLKEMPDIDSLKNTLLEHDKWVSSKGQEGECADFSGIKFEYEIDFENIFSSPSSLVERRVVRGANKNERENDKILDFSEINFEGAVLINAVFNGVLLNKANFKGATLYRAQFTGAKLIQANFKGAILDGAIFAQAQLKEANFQCTNLRATQFTEAQLQGASFQCAKGWSTNFEKAELQEARFQDAEFEKIHSGHALSFIKTNLNYADFTRAKIRGAELLEADILEATFAEADLSDTKFGEDVKGHNERQFAGAILTGCHLPTSIEKFEGLSNIEEVTKSGRKLFISLMLGCIYALLTIIGTNAENLLTSAQDSMLPIFQAKVKIVEFYIFSPLVLLLVYLWLHLYLHKNYWSRLAMLPAYFPGGTKIDERIFPWHFGGFILKNFPHLRKLEQSFVSRVQYILSIISFWCVAPATIGYFWLKYLAIHDWNITTWHVFLFLLAIILGWSFFISALKTLRRTNHKFIPFMRHGTSRWVQSVSILCVLGSVGVIVLSVGAISGYLAWHPLVANLENSNLSGLNLAGTNFRNANLTGAKLQRTNLRGSYLEGAKMIDTQIDGTDFQGARMQRVKLTYKTDSSTVVRSDFKNVNFSQAKLAKIDFTGSHVNGVIFDRAWLWRVELKNSSDISYDQLEKANSLFECNLSPIVLNAIKEYRPGLLNKPAVNPWE